MKFLSAAITAFALSTSLPIAAAFCRNSVSCLIGGSNVCNNVCVRQGNPNGGRCMPRDGCPGYDICACYPRSKRDAVPDEVAPVIDGDELVDQVLRDVGLTDVAERAVEGRDVSEVEKRSICCSLVPPFKGLCCENHCAWIGKPGGQCSDKDICTCN